MANGDAMKHHATLKNWISEDATLMRQLESVNQLALEQCCIGAGAIRNLVWDRLHDQERTPLNDVDVVYFDDTHLTKQQEFNYQQTLMFLDPTTPWEVVNQARVHHWYEPKVPALQSLSQGISTWPETATCVGAYLENNDIHIIAPHGLSDLFELKLVHNPIRMNVSDFMERQIKKRFQRQWPKLVYEENTIAISENA
jgi:hypothetical protein